MHISTKNIMEVWDICTDTCWNLGHPLLKNSRMKDYTKEKIDKCITMRGKIDNVNTS